MTTIPMNASNWDWRVFFNTPESDLSEDDWWHAESLAAQWPTCACGQLCKNLPRHTTVPAYASGRSPNSSLMYPEYWVGRPKDEQLADMGFTFLEHIAARDMTRAAATFDMIEARTAQLLAEGAAK